MEEKKISAARQSHETRLAQSSDRPNAAIPALCQCGGVLRRNDYGNFNREIFSMTYKLSFRFVLYLAAFAITALVVFNKHCDGTIWWPV